MILVRLIVALAFLPVRLSFALAGLVVVPVCLLWYDRTGRWPRLLETWHNRNDPAWDLPEWYTERYSQTHAIAKRFPRWWWFAVRNPANNMRFWFREPDSYIDEKWEGPVTPANARLNGGSIFRYRHSGLLAEFWYIRAMGRRHHLRFRLGWKLGQTDSGHDALGYAVQFMPYRRG